MIDIRDVAEKIASAGKSPHLRLVAHAALRNYAVELLMNLQQAIRPETDDEVAIVAWLREQIVQVAKQIPQPEKVKEPT